MNHYELIAQCSEHLPRRLLPGSKRPAWRIREVRMTSRLLLSLHIAACLIGSVFILYRCAVGM